MNVRYTLSTATYDRESDIVRLVVKPGSHLQVAPGQYYYLYQPFRLKGWESHPFTLGTWTFDEDRSARGTTSESSMKATTDELETVGQSVSEMRMPLLSGNDSEDTSINSKDLSSEAEEEFKELQPSLVFWIRPYDGWTRSLRDQCLRSPDQTINSTILIEGPYGETFPIWEYESVLLIAGGTGIALASCIQEHLERSEKSYKSMAKKTRTNNIHLIWSCRQRKFMENIVSNELRHAFGREDFHASLYESRKNSRDSRNPELVSPSHSSEESALDMGIEQGRPDVRLMVMNQAAIAAAEGSNMVVIVCGPVGMANEARDAVYEAMRHGYKDIRYVEESFSW